LYVIWIKKNKAGGEKFYKSF